MNLFFPRSSYSLSLFWCSPATRSPLSCSPLKSSSHRHRRTNRVSKTHAGLRKELNSKFGLSKKLSLYLYSHVFLSVGILQAQSLLNQLPLSQANLLPTQPSITIATQVGNDARVSFKLLELILPDSKPIYLLHEFFSIFVYISPLQTLFNPFYIFAA